MSNITINIITHNEEIMLPFIIEHYRKMFKSPKFIVHDNSSNDLTLSIAEKEGCIIIPFTTEGMNDTEQSKIKSRAVNECDTEWCLCIDADEASMITDEDLKNTKADIIRFQGWDIFDNVETPWLAEAKGCKSEGYSKPCLVRVNSFINLEFAAGAHTIQSLEMKEKRNPIYSEKEFNLLHYKHWSPSWVVGRSAYLASRQSKENLEKKHSFHFAFSKEQHLKWFWDHYNVREVINEPRLKLKEEFNHNDDGSFTIS